MTENYYMNLPKRTKKLAGKLFSKVDSRHPLTKKWLKEQDLSQGLKLTDIKPGMFIVLPILTTDQVRDEEFLEVEIKEFKNNVKHVICKLKGDRQIIFAFDDSIKRYICPEFIAIDDQGRKHLCPDFVGYVNNEESGTEVFWTDGDKVSPFGKGPDDVGKIKTFFLNLFYPNWDRFYDRFLICLEDLKKKEEFEKNAHSDEPLPEIGEKVNVKKGEKMKGIDKIV